eukprot:TRINITY_DN25303_c0_g2_i1.p2 TRINITY_DN25303_c0_g2~~TRINITY_DN25303_c0_g2_i1.p2  ORF type:complete len:141 (+),score=28.50 TRINITY_DN25303_c0_g2_i1:87-509(+)
MGRRRARRKPPSRVVKKLPTSFDCPFCNHAGTIRVRLQRSTQIGRLECTICGIKAETRTTHLTREVDVYCEWMDQCVDVNEEAAAASAAKRRRIDGGDAAAPQEEEGGEGSDGASAEGLGPALDAGDLAGDAAEAEDDGL